MLCVLAPVRTFSQHPIPRIDKFLSEEFSLKEPGAAVLISIGDSIVYRKGFGDVNPNMVFQIASMTKQFTGAAIAELARAGKLNITDPIQKHVDFPAKSKVITIEDLLSHTSGIPEFFDIDENEKHLVTKKHSPAELIAYFKDWPLDAQPGYSNSNYVLLGAVIESVSGVRYSEYLAESFFKPFAMNKTSVWYDTQDNIALGHPNVSIDGSILFASGNITSTVDDLFTWTKSWVAKNPDLYRHPGYHYGMNVKELQGSKTLQHGGNLFGYTSSGIYLPSEKIFVCILANSAFRGTQEMADYIASEMIGKPIDVPRNKAPANPLEEYTGTYQLEGTKRLMKIVVVSNILVLTFPDQPGGGVDIQFVERDVFESRKVKGRFKFSRDTGNRITSIEVKQGKETYLWHKE